MIAVRDAARLTRESLLVPHGKVLKVVGLVIEATSRAAALGDLCRIGRRPGLLAEVVGFRDGRLLLTPLGETDGVAPGAPVRSLGRPLEVPVGAVLLGRVLDALGRPIDGRGGLGRTRPVPSRGLAPDPLARRRVSEPLATGVRAIDA